MGLDMYLSSYDDWDEKKNDLKEDWNELYYWRKCNWLHKYFCDHGIEKENEILYIIPKEEIINLMYKISLVLKAKDKVRSAKKNLPTHSGFFYGGTDYDDWYFNSLLCVLNEMSELLLDHNYDKYVYYASW